MARTLNGNFEPLQHGRVVPIKSRLVLLDYYVLGSIGGRRRWAAGGGEDIGDNASQTLTMLVFWYNVFKSEYMRRHSE